MKENGNNLRQGDYYLGLDVGTNSVGWAVTDTDYNISRFHSNSMWGVRLFDEANDASGRRSSRTSRRRLARRKQRLLLLELMFAEEIAKIDPDFFVRLRESSLFEDDKTVSGKYALFNDSSFSDKDYLKAYPTVFHLRSDLLHSTEAHDVRLVFLALHHIIKNRGHFLFDSDVDVEGITVVEALEEFNVFLGNEYGYSLQLEDVTKFADLLEKSDVSVTAKKKLLKEVLKKTVETDEMLYSPESLTELLAGATVNLQKLFLDDSLKDADKKSVCLKGDLDVDMDELISTVGDRIELILQAKKVFDAARLSQILDGNSYISDAKISLYNKNRTDLKRLKVFVKEVCPDRYKHIFSEKKDKLNNYTAYSGYKLESGEYKCGQEEFCKFLASELSAMKNFPEYNSMYEEIENKTFLTRLIGSGNSVVPHQLHLKELEKILANATAYLPFLSVKDDDGLSVADKIVSIFKFKIPYYVGPLNKLSPNSWLVRGDDKIYPWNFDKVVDTEQSAEKFILNLIGRCTYTADYVIPHDSLLYSEYMVRNEINLLRVNGHELPRDVMDSLYNDLFVESKKKVTKKGIREWLVKNGHINKDVDEISGIDDTVKSSLKSYHDFKRILEKTKDTELVEEVIKRILIFGDDKKMLRAWLKKACPSLDKSDVDYVCRLKYKDWGRFSKEFLTEIYHVNADGEALSIMDLLRTTNTNLMMLLSSDYTFLTEAKKRRQENVGSDTSVNKRIDEMYISPAVKRSVRQTLRIIDEIVDIKKSAPKKIFIEVARGTVEDLKGVRTVSRKDRLVELYKACGMDSDILFEKLNSEEENRLRQDKLYLYYVQLGRCMYSGNPIDFDLLMRDNLTYDIDHIFPQSRVKDDSLDNRVLVDKRINIDKSNVYPISADIRRDRYGFWKELREKGLITDKKFNRLVRSTELTDKELSEFVARQLVETQQSTKAIATLIKELYSETRVVYSKAGNVSDFRKKFELFKCRDANDLHHAKDAYLNIVVGNVYDTKFTEKFFMNIRRENYSLNRVFEYETQGAWVPDVTIVTVKKYMSKNNVLVTRMPREEKGQLFDLQILPAGKGQLAVKEGREIDRYGGYNNVSGAHFCVVEHTHKKKRVRTLEPVFVYKKALFDSNHIKYCVEVLKLVDPVIIAPIVRLDSLLELDGMRLNISGRTGDRILYKHSYQLTVDEKHSLYIKKLVKYIGRCTQARRELEVTEFDGITEEENRELYSWFIERLQAKVYERLFKNVVVDMTENANKFYSMSLFSQCKLLLEVLKAFKCDRQCPNFSELCGKGSVGTILYNKSISKFTSAILINQSITGLFEIKVDLLK